jgi:hypothetical protein
MNGREARESGLRLKASVAPDPDLQIPATPDLDRGQILVRKVDGSQSFAVKPSNQIIDLAACSASPIDVTIRRPLNTKLEPQGCDRI